MALVFVAPASLPASGSVNPNAPSTSPDANLGSKVFFTAVPAADEFLYLTLGATTDADYTAGKLLIELMGYEA